MGFVVGIVQVVLNFIPCIGQILSFILTLGIVVYTSTLYSHLFGQFGRSAFGQNQAMTPIEPA